jgi:hypothetical protein
MEFGNGAGQSNRVFLRASRCLGLWDDPTAGSPLQSEQLEVSLETPPVPGPRDPSCGFSRSVGCACRCHWYRAI